MLASKYFKNIKKMTDELYELKNIVEVLQYLRLHDF